MRFEKGDYSMTIKGIFCKSLWMQLLLLSVMGILGYNAVVSAEDAEEWMPDPTLRETVRETLDIPAHVPLTLAHLQSLGRLDVPDKGIVDLTGLEHATHCHALILEGDEISDISPLSGLTKLAFLDLSHNQISDIRPLAGLTGLYQINGIYLIFLGIRCG